MHVLDANEIFGMTFYTYDRIIESGNSDALVLYINYMKQSKMQDTTTTFSLDKFMYGKLKWGKDRFYKAKKVLKELGLIDVIQIMGTDGKFADSYVRVNFLIDDNRVRNAGTTYQLTVVPETRTPVNKVSKCLYTKLYNNIEGEKNCLNEKPVEFINVYEDIQEIITDYNYRAGNNLLLKCLIKFVNGGYKIEKKESEVKEFVERIKDKEKVYNVNDGELLQIFDQWCEYHKGKGDEISNYKNSVITFIKNYKRFNKK